MFSLAHHEMQHFLTNIHSYILVEVLDSSWSVFIDEMKKAKDLDKLIINQKKFMSVILDRALLSDGHRELYKHLQRLLNTVYMFNVIKDKYFYKSALQECERLVRV